MFCKRNNGMFLHVALQSVREVFLPHSNVAGLVYASTAKYRFMIYEVENMIY